jgi:hypothetical protein
MASARPITDHDEIREWAEDRGARPACVKGTGGKSDTGMIRLDFPGFSGAESLQKISWAAWFRQFDENNLALMVQDRTARGQSSNFNKLVSRDTANAGRARTRKAGTAGARSGAATRGAAGARKAAGAQKTAGARKTGAAGARKAKTSGGRTAATRKSTSTRTPARTRAADRKK